MQKFLIRFNFRGFLFSAKVTVKRDNGRIYTSTTVIDTELMFLLGDGALLFVQQGKGFELLLFKKDRAFEMLDWKVKLEYADITKMPVSKVFSLS
ncbi:MAG: hypothetical protein M3040_08045 [Bacteroidota bacterium]|nr:hypothetical protein [Bacteroidota bacterium]